MSYLPNAQCPMPSRPGMGIGREVREGSRERKFSKGRDGNAVLDGRTP